MSNQTIDVQRDAGIVTCTLSNPPKHTLTAAGVFKLHQLLDELATDPSVRVLVLTGAAPGVFVAHYEVGELADTAERAQGKTERETAQEGPQLHAMHELCLRLEALPAITIAALNGNAAGGGLELALACDFRLLADGPYRLGLPETSVGIIPGAGGTQRLTQLLGRARALDLILHARLVDPAQALSLGLVHRLFGEASFGEDVAAFAKDLAQRAPVALASAKEAIYRGGQADSMANALLVEQACFDRAMRSEDAAGAMRAWLTGQTWQWKGR